MHEYCLDFELDLGKAIPEVGSICDGVNSHLSTMGIQDKVVVLTPITSMTMQSPTPLPQEVLDKMRDEALTAIKAKMPHLSITAGNFCCKSHKPGNQPTNE